MNVPGWKCAAAGMCAVLLGWSATQSQVVNVKFRYQPQGSYVRVHFPGQFNGWGPNSSGTIAAGTPSQADSQETATGLWVKTVPFSFGTYQYKIYRQLSATPTDWSWISDPLNRVVLAPDQNSVLAVDSLVLFQISAYPYKIETGTSGSTFVVQSGLPRLSAGVFQPAGSPAAAFAAWLDGSPIANPGSSFDQATSIFSFVPPSPLSDGGHTFKLRVTAGLQTKVDSVAFEIRARAVQISTPPFTTRKSVYITAGVVFKPDASGPDSSVSSVTLSVNGTQRVPTVLNGVFSDSTPLSEGLNRIRASTPNGSDSVLVTRLVNHSPVSRISTSQAGASVTVSALSSFDPDGQALTDFRWFDDASYPLGLSGKTGATVSVTTPPLPGEYYFGLIVTAPDGHADTTRSSFIVNKDGSVDSPTIAGNPGWAKAARVYFLFPKAASAAGTLIAAAQRLQNIKDLGFNVIWLMPVFKNAYPINNGTGPGYNIIDFYTVAPEYGTNQDLKDFVDQAHALSIKVILDITPNHTSRSHPWAANARSLGQTSPYWNWYEHTIIPHNTNGLGQSLDAYGFNYYTGFSDQLLNFNWRDVDGQAEMINIFKYWVQGYGVDGYRFDVYWGPHRRYGEQYMGKPVRDALKHIKPDILILGEDDGTGSGTETIYADYASGGSNGGVDAAYDFKLYFNQIRGFGFSPTAVNALHSDIDNGGYYPGKNSLYMRFLESQDEDRIVYFYSSNFTIDAATTFQRTMPMASVVFTAPGFPMLWNGQEVGWGYGITGSKESRNRSVIDWNYQGKGLLSPHYQKLAHIRGQFPAFVQHKQDTNGDGAIGALDDPDFVRAGSSNPSVYAFTRPYLDQNGLTVVNFTAADVTAQIDLTVANAMKFSGGIQSGKQYYLNDLYGNTRKQVTGSALNGVSVSLPPYGTAIFTVSVTADTLFILNPILGVGADVHVPEEFALEQNYPNPFNPATTIRFSLPAAADISLKVFDVLGREVTSLAIGQHAAGVHTVVWDGTNAEGNAVGSGVYFHRLTLNGGTSANSVFVRKMALLK
jgi:glycosidase